MSLTLKQTLDMVVSSSGALPSNSWANSTNASDRQMIALANMAVLYLREKKFQSQIKQTTFTVTPDSSRYAPPTAMLGIVPDTMWVQSSIWKVDFPADPSLWAYLQARAGPTGIVVEARMIDNAIAIFQAPYEQSFSSSADAAASFEIGYEYYTKACVFGINDSQDPPVLMPKEFFNNDQDTHLFDDMLLISEIKWRYKKEKGIEDWSVDLEDARKQLTMVLGRDKGAKTIEPCMPWNPEPQCNEWVYS